MIFCKVLGTVVATRKDKNIVGRKLLLVEEVSLDLKPKGKTLVAVDSVGAGVDEIVLVASGSSARQTELTKDRPIDAVIMAIIDSIEESGKTIYNKDS